MSRTAITTATALTNSMATVTLVDTNGSTGTDGHSIATVKQDDRLILVVKNTGSATGLLTVYAGDQNSAGIGNSVTIVGGDVTRVAGPFEGARFSNADGTMHIGAGFTGTVGAIAV